MIERTNNINTREKNIKDDMIVSLRLKSCGGGMGFFCLTPWG